MNPCANKSVYFSFFEVSDERMKAMSVHLMSECKVDGWSVLLFYRLRRIMAGTRTNERREDVFKKLLNV